MALNAFVSGLRRVGLVVVMLAGLVVSPARVDAQSATGAIQGTVVDQSGGVLPGATVTITNTATGAVRSTVTDSDGRFSAELLPVGPYDVSIDLQGFATRKLSDVELTIGQTLTIRGELRVGGVAESLTVTAPAPVLEVTRTQVSSVVNSLAVASLPVNGRNFIDFVLLTPGVTKDVRLGDISFAGQRGTLNSLVIDGADNNNTFFGQTLGRTGSGRAPYQFSQDAVQEFQVNSSAYSAEYGRAGGAVINVVTKSGTNKFSGGAFEFFRDKALNANDAINEQRGLPKPPYHYNQFGGNIGGPIQKDGHFFFFDYDGQRNTQPNQVIFTVPPGTPSDPDTLAGIAKLQQFAQSWTRGQNQDTILVKTDHQLLPAHRVTLRYNHQNFVGRGFENSGPQIALEDSGDSKVNTDTFNGIWTGVFGARLFNEAKVQYARDKEPGTGNTNNPQAIVRQGGTTILQIGRNFFDPRETSIKRWQAADSVTYVAGAHKLKSGVDLQFDRIFNTFPGNAQGVYTFNSFASFARGVPNGAGDTYVQAFAGAGTTGFDTHPDIDEYSVFAQDEWRLNAEATVNLGVRYDVQKFARPPVRNPDPQLAAADIDTSRLETDGNNWGPRLGFAWAPTARPYVVRAGYGIFYGRTPSIMVGTAHSNNGINANTYTFTGAQVPTYPAKFDTLPPGGSAPKPVIDYFDKNYESPRVQQASAGVEWQVAGNTTLAINYLFVKGDSLQRATDVNIGPASPITLTDTSTGQTFQHYRFAAGPFTNFSRIIAFQSTAESRYNGLTLELNRRLAGHLQGRVAYTLGKVTDTVPDATAVVANSSDDVKFASNPTNFEADRAVGNNDQRHRLVLSGVFDTNGLAGSRAGVARTLITGWTFSAIFTAQSGQPYSAYVATDINNDGNRRNDYAPGTTRNQFTLPAIVTLDPRIARDISAGRAKLQLIFEGFNLLNADNFASVYTPAPPSFGQVFKYTVAGTNLIPNPTFGQFTYSAGPRILQLAVKVAF